jgi:general secretion pathway protein G
MAHCRGFTLVELLVTLVIVGVLASAAIPMAELGVQRAKEKELRHALEEIRTAITAYHRAVDEGRISLNAGESGYPHSLDELANGVVGKSERIYFLKRVPRDPVAEDAASSAAQAWGKRSYASSHEDPKEGADVFDVYSKTPGIGLNGVPYREW